jgi:hypothetical protein
MLGLVIKPLPENFCKKYREENITKQVVLFFLKKKKGIGDSNLTVTLKRNILVLL